MHNELNYKNKQTNKNLYKETSGIRRLLVIVLLIP